jgi:hypothetical protein
MTQLQLEKESNTERIVHLCAYLKKDAKPVVTTSTTVSHEMGAAFAQVYNPVRHCHFSVPVEQQQSIVTDEKFRSIHLVDVYMDTRDNTLLKDTYGFVFVIQPTILLKALRKTMSITLSWLDM